MKPKTYKQQQAVRKVSIPRPIQIDGNQNLNKAKPYVDIHSNLKSNKKTIPQSIRVVITIDS